MPNNDAAYHKNHDDPLNMPPHHMGLWGVNSLIALQSYFAMSLEKLLTDTSTPVQWVRGHAMKTAEARLRPRFGSVARLLTRLGERFISIGAESMIEFIPGQSVTALFRKNR